MFRHLSAGDGGHLPDRTVNPGQPAYSVPRLSALIPRFWEDRYWTKHLLRERRRRLATRSRRHQERSHHERRDSCLFSSQQRTAVCTRSSRFANLPSINHCAMNLRQSSAVGGVIFFLMFVEIGLPASSSFRYRCLVQYRSFARSG